MLRLIIFILSLGAASLGINWLFENDGLVVAEWMGYELQTSISFIIIAIIIALIFTIICLQLFIWLVTLPSHMSHKRDVGNFNHGLTALTEGFAAISAGDSKTAKHLAKKTKRFLGHHQPLALVLEAQAAQIDGDSKQVKKNYRELLENKTTKLIGLKGLLGEATRSGDIKTAIELAEEAYQTSKETEGIVPVLLDLYKREGRWEDALQLVEKGHGRKTFALFAGSKLNTKREKAILNYMYARSLFESDELEKALSLAEKSHKLYPRFSPAMTLIAQASVKLNRPLKASNIIKKAWKEFPRPQLADIYMHIYSKEIPKKQLKYAEKLAAINPKSIESNIIIARAAINVGDFTKARNHLKIAMADGDSVRGCNLMVKAEEGDEDGSTNTINEWLERANKASPDPSWLCKNCSHNNDKWQLVCPQCGSVESFSWGVFSNKQEGARSGKEVAII
jgi:HemY protein